MSLAPPESDPPQFRQSGYLWPTGGGGDAASRASSDGMTNVHHIRPVTPTSVILEETYAPYAPIYLVDSVETVPADSKGGTDSSNGHLLALPKGDIELDEYPKNIGENVVVLREEPPDGGFGWVVTLAAFLCSMVTIGYSQAYGLFIGYCGYRARAIGDRRGRLRLNWGDCMRFWESKRPWGRDGTDQGHCGNGSVVRGEDGRGLVYRVWTSSRTTWAIVARPRALSF
jgi:hypothetical protein